MGGGRSKRERRPAVVDFNVAGFRNEMRRGFDRTATIRWGGGDEERATVRSAKGRRCVSPVQKYMHSIMNATIIYIEHKLI
jgi:hypothetical protein